MAYFDFSDPRLAPEAISVVLSAIGGFILLISGALFLFVLIGGHRAARAEAEPYRFSTAVHAQTFVPAALNGYALWLTLMIGLTLTNYGFPIAQLLSRSDTSVPAVYVGTQR
jgi:cytochrome c oxidase subunit 1